MILLRIFNHWVYNFGISLHCDVWILDFLLIKIDPVACFYPIGLYNFEISLNRDFWILEFLLHIFLPIGLYIFLFIQERPLGYTFSCFYLLSFTRWAFLNK